MKIAVLIPVKNNASTIIRALNSVVNQTYFKELKNEDTIDDYLEYYYNLKNYTFELSNADKDKDHIKIYRINNRSHIYHRSILIVW